MAQEDKRSDKGGDSFGDASPDEATQLKKRARRRLIGAVALALLAVIVLPMVMDHQPPPPIKDIQVRIPSPDEGVSQRSAVGKPLASRKDEKPPVEPPVQARQEVKAEARLEPKSELKSEARQETKPEAKPEHKPEPRPDAKPEARAESRAEPRAEAVASRPGEEAWEVQLGAYQELGRVKLLVGKLKEIGVPSYTEKVETPAGSRTRVRAGPFPSQEAAEKARTRIKIVGVDGPVARKP